MSPARRPPPAFLLRAAGLGLAGLLSAAGPLAVVLASNEPSMAEAVAALANVAARIPLAARLPAGLSPLWLPALWGLATLLLIGGLALWAGQRRLSGRLDSIGRATAALGAGDLRYRLEDDGGSDRLAAALNRMLDQIEPLFEGVSGVTNAIAHDLRTPLTEIRTRLEGILRRPDLSDPVAGEVEEAIAGIDRLMSVFNSLLRLAELDSGTRRSVLRLADPVAVTAGVIDFYAPLAEVKGMTLALEPGGLAEEAAVVLSDPPLLAQAVGNLIDNAIKYTPRGGRVLVQVDRTPAEVSIRIIDNGAGIPPEDRARLMRPFQRGDSSRTSPGSGLGLSLVRSIVRFHGGELMLGDAGPGVCATIVLPAALPPPAS